MVMQPNGLGESIKLSPLLIYSIIVFNLKFSINKKLLLLIRNLKVNMQVQPTITAIRAIEIRDKKNPHG